MFQTPTWGGSAKQACLRRIWGVCRTLVFTASTMTFRLLEEEEEEELAVLLK